jgi:membrane protease YdiL (CAAX protease family)
VPISNEVPIANDASALLRSEDPGSVYGDKSHNIRGAQVVDPNNPVWGLGGALLIWIASILVQAIIPVFFLVPFAMHRGLDPGSPEFVKGTLELAMSDRTAILLQVIAILPTHLVTLGLIWALVTRFGKRPFLQSFGWGWSTRLRLWQCLGLGVCLFGAATTLAALLGAEKPTQLEQLITSSFGARYMIAFLAVFTAPFIEEFVYRGVIYSALQRTIGMWGAVVFVAVLFTSIHVPQYWPNIGVISAVALLSIVLSLARAYSGKLLPCIIIHMSFNAVQALILVAGPFFQRSAPTPEPVVPTASMILTLFHFLF